VACVRSCGFSRSREGLVKWESSNPDSECETETRLERTDHWCGGSSSISIGLAITQAEGR
jgi:hypothetical protein